MPVLRPMEHDMMPLLSDAARDDLCAPPPMDPYQVQPLELPSCLEPGPTIAGVPSLRFRSSRIIRRLDVEYTLPLLVTVNGRPVCLLEPGCNVFDPPLELHAGDSLQLEELEGVLQTAVEDFDALEELDLTGWELPAALNPGLEPDPARRAS